MADKARAKAGSLPAIGKSPTGIRGLDGGDSGRPAPGTAHLAVRLGGLRQDAVRDDFPRTTAQSNTTSLASSWLSRSSPKSSSRTSVRSTTISRTDRREEACHRPRPHRAQPRSRRSGEYDLEGLFIRLGFAIDSIGAKRVVAGHHRDAVRRLAEPSDPARRTAPAVRAGSKTRASPPSSPASAATAR